ncbi:MAG: tripartite tricarboxylate transporter TctB family protein [Inquilinaceae bacterium]
MIPLHVLRSPDLWVGLTVAATGLFLLTATADIRVDEAGLVGPRLVPRIVCGAAIGLGLMLAVAAMVGAGKRAARGGDTALPLRAAAVVGLGLLYVPLLGAFGYFIATVIAAAAIFRLFGTRRLVPLCLGALATAALWYLVFIRVMGVFDPPGWIFSIHF